jgi:drug/metabolite transporter (DMT)-like permease
MTPRAWPAGAMALLASLPLGAAATAIYRAQPDPPERAVLLVGVLFLAVLATVLLVYGVRQRRALSPGRLAFVALAACLVLCTAAYLVWAFGQLSYRADILIWSESPFVNDIIKLRTGVSLYAAPADLNSFFYTPGSQLLTYGLAGRGGAAT